MISICLCNTNHKNVSLNLDTSRCYVHGVVEPISQQCFKCMTMVIVSICARLVWCQIPEPLLCCLRYKIVDIKWILTLTSSSALASGLATKPGTYFRGDALVYLDDTEYDRFMELPQICAETSLMMILLDQNWPLFFCIIVPTLFWGYGYLRRSNLNVPPLECGIKSNIEAFCEDTKFVSNSYC